MGVGGSASSGRLRTRAEINAWVGAELRLIPRGGLPQNIFRAVYQNLRAHSLGRKAARGMSAAEVRRWAAAIVREEFPGFQPQYGLVLV